MSAQVIKKPSVDNTRLGDYAASQPISGIQFVGLTTTVSGTGGFIRGETVKQPARKSS